MSVICILFLLGGLIQWNVLSTSHCSLLIKSSRCNEVTC